MKSTTASRSVGWAYPGDIERLRLAAIEVTGAEGFARSSDDVSLRRLANFSLSPALKAAFEQVYGAAFLARLLFAELGRRGTPNLFARVDFDGSIRTNGGSFGKSFEDYGFIAGKAHAMRQMETLLAAHPTINLKPRMEQSPWFLAVFSG